MKLNKQLTILAENAPNYGLSAIDMEKSVIPVIKSFCQKLKHLTYYILKSSQGDLVTTQLVHRENQDLKKVVIYAFVKPQDGEKLYPDLTSTVAEAIPVSHLLLQLFALEPVDSLVFLDNPQNLLRGTEITRQELRTALQQQIEKMKPIYNA